MAERTSCWACLTFLTVAEAQANGLSARDIRRIASDLESRIHEVVSAEGGNPGIDPVGGVDGLLAVEPGRRGPPPPAEPLRLVEAAHGWLLHIAGITSQQEDALPPWYGTLARHLKLEAGNVPGPLHRAFEASREARTKLLRAFLRLESRAGQLDAVRALYAERPETFRGRLEEMHRPFLDALRRFGSRTLAVRVAAAAIDRTPRALWAALEKQTGGQATLRPGEVWLDGRPGAPRVFINAEALDNLRPGGFDAVFPLQ